MKNQFVKLMFVALAAMTFAACEDVPEPYDVPGTGSNVPGTHTEIEGGTGDGTLENPFNAIAALNLGNTLASGETTEDFFYIKGKVVSIKEEYGSQYGNGTFYISENGSAVNQFYVYQAYYLGNVKWTANDDQIKVGDEVVICAKITNYNGTIETSARNGFLYSLNGVNRGGEPQPATPAAEPTGDGTENNPYNVSAALNYTKSLGSDINSPTQVYIKGKISQISNEYVADQYGNATFYISDDGTTSNQFYCYRTLYLGNKKFTAGKTQIKVGDDVIICGNVVYYRGNTPETVQNASYLYSLNGVTEGGGGGDQPQGEAKGDGSLENPYNPTGAIAYAKTVGDAESDREVYIKGKISEIVNEYAADQYGNATFYITEDGESGDNFYCYRTLYLGNTKYTAGQTQIKKGDEVIIHGKVTNYRGDTPETVQNKAYLYSLNGETGGGQQQIKVVGSIDQPVTTTEAVQVIEKLSDGATTEEYYYVKGFVTSIKTSAADVSKYKNIDYFIADEAGSNYVLQIFRGRNLGNTDFTSADQLQVGDEVIVYGQLMKYKNDAGVTPEMAQGNYLVKRNGSTEGGGGGDTPQPGGEVGEIDGNTITAAISAWGLDNEADLTTLKLKDGTTLTFAQNDGKNMPKYYTVDSSARLYALNSLKVVATNKTITNVVLNCVQSRTGNETLKAEVTDNTVQVFKTDTQLTFSGFSGNAINIINDHTSNSGGTQVRIVSIQITYAE